MMRGHQQVFQARLQGFMPRQIFINVGLVDVPIMSKYDDPENGLKFGLDPTIEISKGEMRRTHDFRFLVNCVVHVRGETMDETFVRLLDQIAEKAHHIVACAPDGLMEFKFGQWDVLWTC